jgi:hypothetical protein
MAGELKTQFLTGQTVYAVVLNAAGQAWRTDSQVFESPASANWAHYPVAMTEQSTTGLYEGAFPAAIATAGAYPVLFRQQAGGSPAATDVNAGMIGGTVYWTGSGEAFPLASSAAAATNVLMAGSNLDANVTQWLATAVGLASGLPNVTAANMLSAGAIAAAIQNLGAISFTLVSPIMQNGSISIVAGDDYYNADGRALTWTSSAGVWPNLTGATIALTGNLSPSIPPNGGSRSYNVAGVVSAGGTGTQSVYVELPKATTIAMAVGAMAYDFALIATLSDGHLATLAQGTLTVKAQS